MGCSASKLEELPPVALCRDRCRFVDEAVRQTYALSDAHAAYMQSLKSLGPALVRFFDHSSTTGKSNSLSFSKSPVSHDHFPSRSSSDSHIRFNSDSECENASKEVNFSECSYEQTLNSHSSILTPLNCTGNEPMRSVSSYSQPDYDNYEANTYRNDDKNENSRGDSEGKAPPPPPTGSAWDYLNFFEVYSSYDLPYGSQFDSTEVHERDNHSKENEIVRQVNGDRKFRKDNIEVALKGRPIEVSVERKNAGTEQKVLGEGKGDRESNQGKRRDSEILREIQVLFERASESGDEISRMLDSGKCRCHHKTSVRQGKNDSISSGFNEELGINFGSLSSTLNKLCLWENKLYHEVKAEEKLRIAYQRKCGQLKQLEEKKDEAYKSESMQNLLRNLSLKLKIAIQIVDRLSVTVNTLREEELSPQINEFIQELFRMYKVILECHKYQSQVASEGRNLDAVLCNGKLTDAQFETAVHLKYELQNWMLSFSSWITSQRNFVKSIYNWLLKCVFDEPEKMPDGIATLSPGRADVPPVLVICKNWTQSISALSDIEVIETIKHFYNSIDQLVKQHYRDLQQRVNSDKSLGRKLKLMEREEQIAQKAIQARTKSVVLVAGGYDIVFPMKAVHQTEIRSSNLQLELQQIFEVMERFATKSIKVYEELCLHI